MALVRILKGPVNSGFCRLGVLSAAPGRPALREDDGQ